MKPRHLYYRFLLWWFAPFRSVDRQIRWRNIARRARQQAAEERVKAENAVGRLRVVEADLGALRERHRRSIELSVEVRYDEPFDRFSAMAQVNYHALRRVEDLRAASSQMSTLLLLQLEEIKQTGRRIGE